MTHNELNNFLSFLWSINQWTTITEENRDNELSIARVIGKDQAIGDRDMPQYVVRNRKGIYVRYNTKFTE